MDTFCAALGSSTLAFSSTWLFFNCGASQDQETRISLPGSYARSHIAANFRYAQRRFTIPRSWMEETLDEAMPDAYLDRVLLKSLREIFRDIEGQGVLIAVPDNEFDRQPNYPAPMVYLNDLPFDHPHSLKRCMARLFSHHYAGSFERDLSDVMQVTLPGFFRIPGCQVLSNPPNPPAISVPQSHESIECRMLIADDDVTSSLWIPLLIAIPWDGRPLEEGAAELAKRFEWSLSFIVNLHSLVCPGEGLPRLCSLLGVLYTHRGIAVYAHYARPSEYDSKWHYVSVLLSAQFADNFMRPNTFDIADVVAVLLFVQRHTSEVQGMVSSWLDRRLGENK